MTTRYCSLYRIGYWASLDAIVETEAVAEWPGMMNHNVHLRIINRYGHSLDFGFAIFTGGEDIVEVIDENGDTHPDLETGIRAFAEDIIRMTAMPGRLADKPHRYETTQGTIASAFDEWEPAR